MYITADTRDKVFAQVLKDDFFEDILKKYFSSLQERKEFKQELWVHLCNIADEKILKAWNGRFFPYLYINIIKNQILSSSSKWNKYRTQSRQTNEVVIPEESEVDEFEFLFDELRVERTNKLKLIDEAIKYHLEVDPKFIMESNLFKLKFYEGMTLRQIATKTKIDTAMVYRYINYAVMLIKHYIKKKTQNNLTTTINIK